MNKKPIIALLFVSVVGVALGLKSGRSTVRNISALQLAPDPQDTGPTLPENLTVSRQQLQAMSEMMKQKLLPRLKAMPAELKRMQKMVEMNDKLIQQMPALESQPVPAR